MLFLCACAVLISNFILCCAQQCTAWLFGWEPAFFSSLLWLSATASCAASCDCAGPFLPPFSDVGNDRSIFNHLLQVCWPQRQEKLATTAKDGKEVEKNEAKNFSAESLKCCQAHPWVYIHLECYFKSLSIKYLWGSHETFGFIWVAVLPVKDVEEKARLLFLAVLQVWQDRRHSKSPCCTRALRWAKQLDTH